MSEEATKVKRTRTMGTILVERLHEGGGWKPITGLSERTTELEAIQFDTSAKAEKWIQDNGEDGATYRVMREVLVVTVKIEQVRKTSLFKQ